jgi:hypothetical protein
MMRAGHRVRLLLALGVVAIASAVAARTQDPPATAKSERQMRLDQQYRSHSPEKSHRAP